MNARWHSRSVWVAAFLLMCGGVAWFVITPSSLAYWLGGSFSVPFALMVLGRAEREGFESDAPLDTSNMGDGPWGPP